MKNFGNCFILLNDYDLACIVHDLLFCPSLAKIFRIHGSLSQRDFSLVPAALQFWLGSKW